MDFLSDFLTKFGSQLQSPTLGFLIGGIVIAAFGSRLTIPDAVYKFIVFMLLIKVGLSGGIAIRNANITEMLLPALFAVLMGILIVFIGRFTLAKLPGIRTVDAVATAGLFGAVSGSTLAAGITVMEGQGVFYEPWAAALYPFMDIPALVTAIVVASLYKSKQREVEADDFSKQPVAAGEYSGEPVYPPRGRNIWVKSVVRLLIGLKFGPLLRKVSRVLPYQHCCSSCSRFVDSARKCL